MNTHLDHEYSTTDTVLHTVIVGGLAAFLGLVVFLPSVVSVFG